MPNTEPQGPVERIRRLEQQVGDMLRRRSWVMPNVRDLRDVTANKAVDGDTLTYDSTIGRWVAGAGAGGAEYHNIKMYDAVGIHEPESGEDPLDLIKWDSTEWMQGSVSVVSQEPVLGVAGLWHVTVGLTLVVQNSPPDWFSVTLYSGNESGVASMVVWHPNEVDDLALQFSGDIFSNGSTTVSTGLAWQYGDSIGTDWPDVIIDESALYAHWVGPTTYS